MTRTTIDEIPAGWRVDERSEFGEHPSDYQRRYYVQRWGTREIRRYFRKPVIITVWNDVVSFGDREQAKQYIIDTVRAMSAKCECGEHGRQVPTS